LPHLKDEVYFNDLQHAIGETVGNVEKQTARMEMIFELLDDQNLLRRYSTLNRLVDDAFEAIREQKKAKRNFVVCLSSFIFKISKV
jgi:hypothetical protein